MPKKHLTSQFIRNLKPKDKRTEYYDQHLIEDNTLKGRGVKGLFIRLTKAGNVYFYYRYYFNEKYKSYKIGSYPDLGLSDARDKARELSQKVTDGNDPQAEKNERKQTPDPQTFNDLANEFKDKYLPTLRESTRKEYKRIIDKELLPTLGKHAINGITPNQIISLLDGKAYGKDPAPVMANRIRARLSKVFNFAIDRRLIESNPVEKVKKYKKSNNGSKVEKKRSRWYKPNEIQELWEYFEGFQQPTGQVFKMLLICGQRKTETMQMKWNDIRGDVWTIPAELAKNKEEHLVPLSDMALDIIESMRPITGESDYIFCSPRKENEPLAWLTRARETIKNDSNIPDFRPHDLRRTFATFCSKLGVDRTVLGKILNHKGLAGDDQVIAIYDRYRYSPQKREAMNRWSHKLQQIIEGKEANVFKLG